MHLVSWIGEVVRYRHLLWMLTLRDITIKYKQSILGVLWAILMPTVIVLAGIVVKLAFAMVSGRELSAAEIAGVSVKAVPWALFVGSIRFSSSSLIGNANLVTKISFPRLVLPLAAILSQVFDFIVASLVLFVFLSILGVNVGLPVLIVPVLIFILLVLITGLGIFLSAASLFFRDVKYIVEIVLTFAIFFTPVFYEVSLFKEWGTLLLINPVAPLLEGIRSAVVDQQMPDLRWVGYSAVVSVLILIGSLAFFKQVEPAFAECV